jgi:hypothetical protein
MTTQAPIQTVPHAPPAPPRERHTEPHEATASELILDPLSLLDHRSRTRTIRRRLAPRGHYLELGNGDEARLLPLDEKITHIGRGSGAELRFDEQRVSRSHAIIVLHGRYARLLDNRSSNGTFLNGRRVVATNISDGDVIRVGPVAMQYVYIR